METNADKSDVSVRVLDSDAELLACKDAWQEFQMHPNVDWGFYHLINRVRNQTPCVLELRDGGKTKALWVGRIEEGVMPITFGYLKLGRMRVKQLNILNGGIMGDESEESCSRMFEGVQALAADRKLDFVALNYVSCGRKVFQMATRQIPGLFCRDFGVIKNEHWKMELPGSYEDFLKKRSKKHRYWLKRLTRVLEDDFPGEVKIRAFTKLDESDEFCREADAVAKLTYQHQLGSAFSDNEEYRSRCKLSAEQGALRGYILYVKQKPVAYWYATACRATLHLNYTGYDPEYKKYEVGTVLFMKLIEDHCGGKMKEIDFGLGGAVYKERFGDINFLEATVRIYRPTPRALFINVLIGGSAKVTAGIKTMLLKMGLLQRIKTFWRSRMSGK
jgi:Acetyltransferase (GNAT) domain